MGLEPSPELVAVSVGEYIRIYLYRLGDKHGLLCHSRPWAGKLNRQH